MDPIRRIQAYNQGRDPERLALKYRKMRANAFVFLRGSCHLFYDRLPSRGLFKSAPATWLCGDLHLENFGSYKGDNRLVYFDLNDFDESVLAPASLDLVRMLASLRTGADSIGIDDAEAGQLCEVLLDAYAAALVAGKAYWIERDTAQGLVRTLLDALRERKRAAFLAMRTQRAPKERTRRLIADGRKALPATPAQREQVTAFMAGFAASQPDPAFYEVIDVARRIAGTGSLGVARYSVLVHGKGSPDANYLLDLKQALPSSLAPHIKTPQPTWASEAHRVVAAQRRMQAVPMAFLDPVSLDGMPCVLRALQPVEDRMTLDRAHQTRGELAHAIATLGRAVAWAQLRSTGRDGSATADELIEFGLRRKWRGKLLEASREAADQVAADWRTFGAAYDAGVFEL